MSEERLSVLWVWSVTLGNAPERDGVYKSPFRADRTPSLSVSRNGTVWHDFGTGDGGDAYDFAAKAYDLDVKRDFKRIKSLLGQDVQSSIPRIVKDTGKKHESAVADPDTLALIRESATAWRFDADSEMMKFITAKKIHPVVVRNLIREGSLGALGPWPVFLYDDGVKIRYDHATSRSARWLVGSANHRPWRERALDVPGVHTAVIFEGESDLMWGLSCLGWQPGVAYIAAPSAGWRPDQAWIESKLSGVAIVTAFDYDAAGRTATKWWVKNAASSFIDWRKTSLREGDDFSKLPAPEARMLLSAIKKI
jgi:hypothetical protein